MALKLLIFDLDGTLVDSSVDISCAINAAFAPYGVPEVTVAETISLVGEGLTRLIEKVIERKAPGLDRAELVTRFLAHYSLHLADHTLPYPGAADTLLKLASYRKAVLSNKTESLSLDVLEATGLAKHFDYVAGGDTLSEKKPSPVPVLHILSRFDATPDEAIIIGDSIYDIEAGRAAGLRTVAVLYGYGAPPFPDGADYRIESITDLPALVRRID